MYAKIENGLVKVYVNIPNKYVSEDLNVAGGFDKLTPEIHMAQGFYPLVEPEYNRGVEKLVNLHFDEDNQIFTYNKQPLTAYEIAMIDWAHPEYEIRITAPAGLIDQYPSIALWMQLNNLPMNLSVDGENIILYMNEIKPQHQQLFNSLFLNHTITKEQKPENNI